MSKKTNHLIRPDVIGIEACVSPFNLREHAARMSHFALMLFMGG